jgi:flagellar hook-basal body complex protein FliE
MSIDPISMAGSAIAELRPAHNTPDANPSGFAEWLTQQISVTNNQIIQADDGVRRLALGETDNLHQVMIQLEKAKLSFELIMQVRNKLLEAYQDVMRMQI